MSPIYLWKHWIGEPIFHKYFLNCQCSKQGERETFWEIVRKKWRVSEISIVAFCLPYFIVNYSCLCTWDNCMSYFLKSTPPKHTEKFCPKHSAMTWYVSPNQSFEQRKKHIDEIHIAPDLSKPSHLCIIDEFSSL